MKRNTAKRIRFTATCGTEQISDYLQIFLQDKLDDALLEYAKKYPDDKEKLFNLVVETAGEIDNPQHNVIEGEVCPVCGYNGEFKIVNLTDEFITVYCPQCHSKFNVSIGQDAC